MQLWVESGRSCWSEKANFQSLQEAKENATGQCPTPILKHGACEVGWSRRTGFDGPQLFKIAIFTGLQAALETELKPSGPLLKPPQLHGCSGRRVQKRI